MTVLLTVAEWCVTDRVAECECECDYDFTTGYRLVIPLHTRRNVSIFSSKHVKCML